MIHERDRLPLGLETGDDVPRVHAELDNLERHAAADRLLLLGHVNDAATTLANFLQEFVALDAVPGFLADGRGEGATQA